LFFVFCFVNYNFLIKKKFQNKKKQNIKKQNIKTKQKKRKENKTKQNKMELERFDFVFSYWIIVWFLLFEFKWTNLNPKVALGIGLIENIGLLFLMIFYQNSVTQILLFCFINLFLKVLPLWIVRNTSIHTKDVLFLMALFLVYIFWLVVINKKNLREFAYQKLHAIQTNKPIGPMMYFLEKKCQKKKYFNIFL
jgi:hypothetical protein